MLWVFLFARSQSSASVFDVVWNGPSSKCKSPMLTMADYGVRVNPNQTFTGSVISLIYKSGEWPRLSGSYNATPCWSKHTPGCSYDPWGNITIENNGGVPQMANITLHTQKLAQVIASVVQDENSTSIVMLDWEAWRSVIKCHFFSQLHTPSQFQSLLQL